MSASTNGQVYQTLLSIRLRELHGNNFDERSNWVTTVSGPQQRPTYTAIFYFDGTEMSRGLGPTVEAARESAAARANARLPRPPQPIVVFPPSRSRAPSTSATGVPSQPEGSGIPIQQSSASDPDSQLRRAFPQRATRGAPFWRPGVASSRAGPEGGSSGSEAPGSDPAGSSSASGVPSPSRIFKAGSGWREREKIKQAG